MVRIILGGVVCLSAVFVGLYLRKRYAMRRTVYLDWQTFLVGLGEQIDYLLTPIPRYVEDYCARNANPLATALRSNQCPPCLKDSEWQAIRCALDDLGQSDYEGQRSRISLAKSRADEWCVKATDEVASKGNLYAKLCVIAGLACWLVML